MNKNPDAISFKDLKGQTLVKLPGSINSPVFNIENLNSCKVYILDISEAIYVDNCVSCEFYVAPVKVSFVMRHSQNSTCSVACRKLSVKNCTNFTFYLYCPSDPNIESSFDINTLLIIFLIRSRTRISKRLDSILAIIDGARSVIKVCQLE